MYFSSPEASIVSPFAGERDISLLMRFIYKVGDGKSLVEHFGHRLRYELIEQWKADPLPQSEQGLAATEVGAEVPSPTSRGCQLATNSTCPSPS